MASKHTGRPSYFTEEIGDMICEKIATHPYGLMKICDMYEEMPPYDTINKWRRTHPDFASKWMEARIQQAHLQFDYTIDILENIQPYQDKDGVHRIDGGIVARARTHIGQINYRNARLLPAIYGDKKVDEDNSSETLSKIQALVADLNKNNVSDV